MTVFEARKAGIEMAFLVGFHGCTHHHGWWGLLSHMSWIYRGGGEVGCALTFASEAKIEIEVKISFRLEAKKSLISHDSLRCETPKIGSKNEGKTREN
jgi:hypothetical protein